MGECIMKKLLLLLFSLMLSFNSYGEWSYIGKDDVGDSYYVDLITLKKVDGYVYAWTLVDNLKPNEYGNMSAVFYNQDDCGITRSKALTALSYKKPMGEELDDSYTDPNPKWEYIIPNSMGEWVLMMTCELVDASESERQEILDLILQSEKDAYLEEWGESEPEPEPEQTGISFGKAIINTDELEAKLQSAWIRNIAAEVKSVWNFPGAEDGWFVEVLVTQNKEGKVLNVKFGEDNVGNSSHAKAFLNSVERAIYKATPLPIAPDVSVWQKDILFTFTP
jgi:hypothetical protein